MSVGFLDANVIVYASDTMAKNKRDLATDLLDRLWDHRVGAVSSQIFKGLDITVRAR